MGSEAGLNRVELLDSYDVESFGALDSNGYGERVVFVTEKATGEYGSMSFSGSPRRYYNFQPKG